ncbi:MAG: SnoaL-like domain-containing protein [Fimbriimonas sp.]
MSTKSVGESLVAISKTGNFREAIDTLYADNIVSIEAQGESREVQGIESVHGKMDWFATTFEVHSVDVQGPWVNEPQFVVRFTLDVTDKASGNRFPMDEFAVYTVSEGKIVHERFFV